MDSMQSLVNRWKHAINSSQGDCQKQSNIKPQLQIKKQRQKSTSKKSTRNHVHKSHDKNKQQKKDERTPNKKNIKQRKILQSTLQIIQLIKEQFEVDKNKQKIKQVLSSLWQYCESQQSQQNGLNQQNYSQPKVRVQSSSKRVQEEGEEEKNTIGSKLTMKLYHDLEKQYYQNEKQKQHYKVMMEQLLRKAQVMQKQIERYHKMENLIDGALERQVQLKKEVIRLRRQLDTAEFRSIEQQKAFKKQIITIHQLINLIKSSLPVQ